MRGASMKIAVVEPVGGHGGCHYYDFGLCRGLSFHGVDVHLYTCDATSLEFSGGTRVSLIYKGIYGSDSAWIRGLRYLRASLRALIESRLRGARIVHFHIFRIGLMEYFDLVVARLLGFRVVATAHDVDAFVDGVLDKNWVKRYYKSVALVVAHNKVSQGELIESLGISQSKIQIIPHGNYDLFLRKRPLQSDARSALGLDPDHFILLFFGQIKDVKGLDVLLRAMPEVLAKCGDRLSLVVAGRPWKSDFSAYQRLIVDLGIEDRVQLDIIFIPDEQAELYYCAASLVVLPYRRIYQSGVVLMALSYGQPVLVSSIPGMTEVVTDGVTGLVFASGDSSDLARKIVWAFENPGSLESIGVAGKKLMETDYNWYDIGSLTKSAYERLL